MSAFTFPDFFEYPPYFTVQPTAETRSKQTELWKSMIHRYCQHHRTFLLDLDDDDHPLFANPRISRKLTRDARRFFVDELVTGGGAAWLEDDEVSQSARDGTGAGKGGAGDPRRRRCLVLWRTIPAWAELMYAWAMEYGYQGQVVTVDEVREGSTAGDALGFRGAPEELVLQAAMCLEGGGKAAVIRGQGGDDAGIKFF
mmetsp:Transcript_44713/g.71777  ORF Transcript_44713/g.71777 Transcript_44713/m.71777 type:complete len:199 (+) Transcript_44713:122-718(+)